jgi:GNAT superfamily N-acetyltransferase
MAAKKPRAAEPVSHLTFHALTPQRWPDFERLFGSNGACGGCWCMWWRVPRAQYRSDVGAVNREAFRALVASGAEPGVLGYAQGQPHREAVAWCAVAPREAYPTLARSRMLKGLDATPPEGLWSVTCLFIHRHWRGQGLTRPLVEAAVAHAAARGARTVEGYPIDTPRELWVPERFTGPLSTFRATGFREVARRSPTRPILRRTLPGPH